MLNLIKCDRQREKPMKIRYLLQNPGINFTGFNSVEEDYTDIDNWLKQPAVYDTDTKLSIPWGDLALPGKETHLVKIKEIIASMEYTTDQIGYYHKRFYQGVIEIIDNRCQ
jgi:hypothetical protein